MFCILGKIFWGAMTLANFVNFCALHEIKKPQKKKKKKKKKKEVTYSQI